MSRTMKRSIALSVIVVLGLIAAFGLLMAPIVYAAIPEQVSWDPVVEPSLTGYRLYYSETSGAYLPTDSIAVESTVTMVSLATLPLEPGKTYYLVVTAFNSNIESAFSNEVAYVPTMPVPVIRLE